MSGLNYTAACNIPTVAVAKPYTVTDQGSILVRVSVPEVGEFEVWVTCESGPRKWCLVFEGMKETGDQFAFSSEVEAIIYAHAKELVIMIEADDELTRHRFEVAELVRTESAAPSAG